MKGKVKNIIIAMVVVLVLLIPIIVENINSKKVEAITYDEYTNLVSSEDFALVYVGDLKSSDYEKIKENLASMKSEFDVKVESLDSVDLTEAQKSELKKVNSEFTNTNVYVFIKDKSVAYVTSESLDTTTLKELINYYYNNIIPEKDVAYKTVDNYTDYMKIVNSKKTTMSVFGRNTCAWCNKFKPVYNAVAKEYNVDIYFFDSDSYDKTEYEKIMNSDVLYIPSSCNDQSKDIPLSDGFGTPLTLFTKKGKVVGCLSGYVNESSLIAKLKDVGMIK